MNCEPLISLIVPVYNVAPYLDECVGSILAQDYPRFEVILVDDGSTDGSGEMCDRIAAGNSMVRVVHRCNGGSSAARNAGVDIAAGEYIAFADSDDVLYPSYLSRLYSMISMSGADVAMAGFFESDRWRQGTLEALDEVPVILTCEEALARTLYQDGLNTSPCVKLFRRSLFEQERFPVGTLYEDLDFVVRALCHVDSVAVARDCLYWYRKRPGSNIGSFSMRRLDVLNVTAGLLDLIASRFPALVPAARDRRLSAAFNMFMLLSANGMALSTEAADCWRIIRELRVESLFNPAVRIKNKIGIMLSFSGRRLFSLMCRILS